MRENDAMKFLQNISVGVKVLIPPAILIWHSW